MERYHLMKWIQKGFSEHEAAKWNFRGFSLDEAIQWKHHGFEVVDACCFKADHMTPEQAKARILDSLKESSSGF